MKKIVSHIKRYKKFYSAGLLAILLAGGAALYWFCPEHQFRRACKDEKICVYLDQRLTPAEKKTFVTIQSYLEKTEKSEIDDGVLKYAEKNSVLEVLIKVNSAKADVARQDLIDNLPPAEKFQGDYTCLRRAIWNELSNEDVLIIQASKVLQAQNVDILKHPVLRAPYISASAKFMKCTTPEIQQAYLAEIQASAPPAKEAPKKAPEKPKTPAKKK